MDQTETVLAIIVLGTPVGPAVANHQRNRQSIYRQ